MSIAIRVSGAPVWFDALRLAALLLAAAVSAYYIREYRRRAARHDHVFECTNDFSVPERCLDCASPHAPFTFDVESVPGYKAWNNAFVTRRKFRFHFCLACARRMRRRRLIGITIIAIGVVLPVASILCLIVAPDSNLLIPPFQTVNPFNVLAVLFFLFALLFVAAGVFLLKTSSSVVILDTGEGMLLFRFHSQLYRNFFAELNGEDFTR